MGRIAAILLLFLAACDSAEPPVPIPETCNGAVELCERRYHEVAYATTHNAMSNAVDGWINPNQGQPVRQQLEDGVRGLMLDLHDFEDEVYLCHSFCQLGQRRLVDELADIGTILRAQRGEVVTLILESYVPVDEVERAFQDSGVRELVYAHDGGPWPTLRQLIDDDTRLVVLSDRDGASTGWFLDVWTYSWETHFSAREPEDFSCADNRGSPDNELFIFNHFLTQTIGSPELAEQVNHNPLLRERALQCMTESGSLPNFVTVDFYAIGDVFAVVDELNGIGAQ